MRKMDIMAIGSHDFYNTDPHFGTLTEFQKLVKEAHKRDMKVMIDFDSNHVGP